MNPQTTPQSLTTEELDALFFRPAEANTAIAQSAELTALQSVFTDLRTASMAAADHHRRHASIAPTRSRAMSVIWAFAAAVIVLCAALPMFFRHHATTAPVVVTTAQQAVPTVSDEVLLADVQADLDASVPSPMLPLTTSTTTKSSPQRTR